MEPEAREPAQRSLLKLEELITAHELRALNDGRETRPGDGNTHSTIDLTLAGPDLSGDCEGWSLLEAEGDATMSDHQIIEWKWAGQAPRASRDY